MLVSGTNLTRGLHNERDDGKKLTNSSDGVWLGDAEMPDAEHLKKDFKTGG